VGGARGGAGPRGGASDSVTFGDRSRWAPGSRFGAAGAAKAGAGSAGARSDHRSCRARRAGGAGSVPGVGQRAGARPSPAAGTAQQQAQGRVLAMRQARAPGTQIAAKAGNSVRSISHAVSQQDHRAFRRRTALCIPQIDRRSEPSCPRDETSGRLPSRRRADRPGIKGKPASDGVFYLRGGSASTGPGTKQCGPASRDSHATPGANPRSGTLPDGLTYLLPARFSRSKRQHGWREPPSRPPRLSVDSRSSATRPRRAVREATARPAMVLLDAHSRSPADRSVAGVIPAVRSSSSRTPGSTVAQRPR
jgi:hypothetical protein